MYSPSDGFLLDLFRYTSQFKPILFDKSSIAKINLFSDVNVVCDGSPSGGRSADFVRFVRIFHDICNTDRNDFFAMKFENARGSDFTSILHD